MKIITILCLLIAASTCTAQNIEKDNIQKVITEFSKAGDENNSEALETYLDDNYRIVMNRLFGSNDVSVIPKSEYLEKIKSKEYGGDKREVTIENIIINGTTASAKVIFAGTKMSFVSLLSLIQNSDGHWRLISDVPIVQ